MSPKKVDDRETNLMLSKRFAKVPNYVKKIKRDIKEEAEVLKNLQIEEQKEADKKMRLMSSRELSELRQSLNNKWDEVNGKYQNYTHIKKPNTIALRVMKEGMEKELEQLEKYIDMVHKPKIFVDSLK